MKKKKSYVLNTYQFIGQCSKSILFPKNSIFLVKQIFSLNDSQFFNNNNTIDQLLKFKFEI